MRLIHDSAPCLLRLLLLAELLVHSSSNPIFCGMLGSMAAQVEELMTASRRLHNLTDEELLNFDAVENKLHGLPHMSHNATYFISLKVNESLSKLSGYAQTFKLHVDWLKTARDNFSLPSQSAEGASTHLLHLTNLLKASLQQLREDAPPSPSASFPAASTAFDVLRFSVETSRQLHVFCDVSRRALRCIRRQSHCRRR